MFVLNLHRHLRHAVSVVLLLFVAGCGQPKPADDAPYLTALNFNTAISVSVSLQQPVDTQGNLTSASDAGLLAVLVHTGSVKVVPNANAAPWWTFAAVNGDFSDNRLTVAGGKRVINKRTDAQSWTDAGNDYYSENVNYSVVPVGAFATVQGIIPTYSLLQLTLQKDASTDQWHIWYGANRPTRSVVDQDPATFLQNIVIAGAAFQADLMAAIQSARADAFNLIEKSYADQGLFRRDNTSVLVSERNGLAYLTQPVDLNGGSYADAERRCQQADTSHQWRLPTLGELHSIVGSDNRLIDVPDGRFWNAMAQANPGQAILLVANTFVVNNGPQMTIDQVNPSDLNQYGWAQFLQINNDRSTFPFQASMDVRTVRSDPVRAGDPGYLIRVMCVAPVTSSQTATPTAPAASSGPPPEVFMPMQSGGSFQPGAPPSYDTDMHFDKTQKPR